MPSSKISSKNICEKEDIGWHTHTQKKQTKIKKELELRPRAAWIWVSHGLKAQEGCEPRPFVSPRPFIKQIFLSAFGESLYDILLRRQLPGSVHHHKSVRHFCISVESRPWCESCDRFPRPPRPRPDSSETSWNQVFWLGWMDWGSAFLANQKLQSECRPNQKLCQYEAWIVGIHPRFQGTPTNKDGETPATFKCCLVT